MTPQICACREDRQCQFHAHQPRPCSCGGILEWYSGRKQINRKTVPGDGGQIVPYIVTENGRVMRDARILERHGGAAWMCNRCEYCKAA